jgi:hypothetical protein
VEKRSVEDVIADLHRALEDELRAQSVEAMVTPTTSPDRNWDFLIQAGFDHYRLSIGHRAMFQLEREADAAALMGTLRKCRWIDFLFQYRCVLVVFEGTAYVIAMCPEPS